MPDMFDQQNLKPMLLSRCTPFDSPHHIFELKLDGFRCIAYCDGEKTILKSRNGLDFSCRFPCLGQMGKSVKGRCILDGELVALKDGKQSRGALSSGRATFAAFDILYADQHDLTAVPLLERKQILAERVGLSAQIIVCQYIDTHGKEFFSLVQSLGLEGIVAKRKQGLYYPARRTKEWCKIKCPNYTN